MRHLRDLTFFYLGAEASRLNLPVYIYNKRIAIRTCPSVRQVIDTSLLFLRRKSRPYANFAKVIS